LHFQSADNLGLYEIVATINGGKRLLVSENISISKEGTGLVTEYTEKAMVFGATQKEAGNMISVVHLPKHKKLVYREDKKVYLGLTDKESDPKVKILWLKDLENTIEKFDSLECQKSMLDHTLKSFGHSVGYLKDSKTLRVV